MSYHTLQLSTLIGSLSYALDLTEGQPEGHCVRVAWIGMRIAQTINMQGSELWDLYYTLLLKDLGCSSNAARICQLYLTDDLRFKRDFKWVDDSLPSVARFVFEHAGLGAGLVDKFKTIFEAVRTKNESAHELISTRCTRGASIARRLRFSERVAQGIHALDEHWNGKGQPEQRRGEAIPLASRIALLAQVIDVFHTLHGPGGALKEAISRRGTWFDPALVDALLTIKDDESFWSSLSAPDLAQRVFELEPPHHRVDVDDDYLDEIAAAFGEVVDSKSPYTSGHSARVALYADRIAHELGLTHDRRRWLRRGALLHDVGKLGVSNTVLDKPGKLDSHEWEQVQRHAIYTENILGRIPHFEELARVAGAHHERLDGKGYPRGLSAQAIAHETRIITTADIFDAITATRPYRGPIPVDKTLEMMRETVGSHIDASCFEALVRVVGDLDEAVAASAVVQAA
jgi:HD-GYP domain-containing protein (c-di-GMP phosphodiesterase class II)